MKRLTIVIALIFGLSLTGVNAQTVDILPPEILEVNVSANEFDVRTESKIATVIVRAKDAVSGVSGVILQLHPGSDYIIPLKLERVAGDQNDGIYIGSITISAGSVSRMWLITNVTSFDAAGNRVNINANEFAQRGFATGFQVISNSPPPPPFNKRKRIRFF